MPVVTLGLNHKTAPLEVREQVVFPAERLDEALAALSRRPGVREAAVLSTCNRTEIYAVLAPEATPSVLQRWLEHEHRLAAEWLSPYLYVHRGRAAVSHLLSVAAGLDSLVLGEPQIFGQAKLAYHSANRHGLLGRTLERLFQHAFSVAKQVRTDTEIGAHPVSVAFAAVTLARQIFGDMDRRTALLIGAGETVELTARHLREQGLTRLLVANRSLERARRIAEGYGGEALELADIPRRLTECDIVVASTASALPILGKGSVERALRQRKHRPMFMVDVAVPRDIEPEVGDLADVYLYTIDDLRSVIDDSLRSREAAARQAESIVTAQTERFMDWLRTLDAVGAIRRYRQQAEREREQVLQWARRQLAAGHDPEQVMQELSRRLTRKLLHAPTLGLREAARSGDPLTIRISHRTLGVEDDADEDGNGQDA
ncbi:glutamyl-tRNA reductase [Sediminicurvatus halobius]|uniref:Glutamyl-tRNA reductase n=1 Tax=Sediminicurvatus halobius TaxID=2182432 RepID=A0A2U2N7Q3_9GAMM|nr:glutamyl-tRNA reductase [Spiribacter halobius]PWG65225.1 glutamyl-tRNA reductase [Spiribacter halobius]UEX78820.1 glutamyl-tRNA reductase [Spiribacter halobius]